MRFFAIGTSADGHQALKTLFSTVSADIDAAFFVAQHMAPDIEPSFGKHLSKFTDLDVQYATEGENIEAGKIYLPVPDHHLLVKENKIHLSNGPVENMYRPAIDPLFRSVAVSRKNEAVGVLLSGYLNDGVAGLVAIKRCGGITIVQEPGDAEFPDLPENALKVLQPDYCVPVNEMGEIFREIVNRPPPEEVEVPEDIIIEAEIAACVGIHADLNNKIGEQVSLSCPRCGGPLWKLKDDKMERYRCHTGHSYTFETLLRASQTE